MKTHKHLFERVCALENILAASHEALRNGKRAVTVFFVPFVCFAVQIAP